MGEDEVGTARVRHVAGSTSKVARTILARPEAWLASALVVKSIVVAAQVDGAAPGLSVVIASLAVAGLLIGPAMAVPGAGKVFAMVVINGAVSGLLLADLMFNGWYGGVVTMPMVRQAGQLSAVGESVGSTFSRIYLLLFLDIAIFIVGLVVYKLRHGTRLRRLRGWRPHPRAAIILGAVALVALAGTSMHAGREAIRDRYGTKKLTMATGPVAYHVLDAGLSALHVNPPDADQQLMRAWEDGRRRSAKPSPLSGIAHGSNLLVIQMEAMQNFLIGRSVDGQEVTPTLNGIIGGDHGLYFSDYHTEISQGNTSDAELMSLTSLYPMASGSAYVRKPGNDFPASLPRTLKASGYRAAEAFHGYNGAYYNRQRAYPALGFDGFHFAPSFTDDHDIGLGLADASFFEQTVDKLSTVPQPWFGFAVSLSGHHPYVLNPADQPLHIQPGEFSTDFSNYLQAQAYSDRALGRLFDELKRRGLLKNTTVVVYGDHFGKIPPEDVAKFTDRDGTDYVDQMNDWQVPLVIRSAHQVTGSSANHGVVIDHTGGQVDLTPTLLDLFGLPSTGFYLGTSLLSGSDLVAHRYYQPAGSFVTDDLAFQAAPDGSSTGGACFERKTHEKLSTSDCLTGYREANWRLSMSDTIIEKNLLPQLVGGS